MEPNLEIPHREIETREERLKDALENIMTHEEYSQLSINLPYSFSLESEGKHIFYYGARHSNDPENPMFVEMERAFKATQPDIVIIEGIRMSNNNDSFKQRVLSRTHEETIQRMSESGFVIQLAYENQIPWYCPEPSDTDMYENLLTLGFSKDEVFAHIVLRVLPQYYRQKHGYPNFAEYAQFFIDEFRGATQWNEFDYSYAQAMCTIENVYKEPIDVENDVHAKNRVDPIPWEDSKETYTVFNTIAYESGKLRDKKIVTDIVKLSEKYNKLFIVYGGTHAVVQEPALRKFFAQ